MTPLLRLYGNWATNTPEQSVTSALSTFSPLLRVAAGLFSLHLLTNHANGSKIRIRSACHWGIVVGCLVWCELSPYLLDASSGSDDGSVSNGGSNNNGGGNYNEYTYHPHSAPLPSVALKLLTFTSVCVGVAMASLVPRLFTGITLGCVSGGLVGSGMMGEFVWGGIGGGVVGGAVAFW